MSYNPSTRGAPPESVLPFSHPRRPTGIIAAHQVSSPHEFLRYQRAILNGTVSQGTDLSHRATANGLARVVEELEGKMKEIQKEIGEKEEEIERLEEAVKEKKAELEPLQGMLEAWKKMKG